MLANSCNQGLEEDIYVDEKDDDSITNVFSISEEQVYDGTDIEINLNDESHGNNVATFITQCNNIACSHSISTQAPTLYLYESTVTDATDFMRKRYDTTHFLLILVGSGCSFISTGCVAQVLAYCRGNDLTPNMKPQNGLLPVLQFVHKRPL